LRNYRSIVIVRIIGCPIRGEICFVSAIGIVVCLVASAVRVHLVGVIIEIGSICRIVWVILICPIVKLGLGMYFSRYLSHILLLSEPKKATHFDLCVVTIT